MKTLRISDYCSLPVTDIVHVIREINLLRKARDKIETSERRRKELLQKREEKIKEL